MRNSGVLNSPIRRYVHHYTEWLIIDYTTVRVTVRLSCVLFTNIPHAACFNRPLLVQLCSEFTVKNIAASIVGQAYKLN